MIVFNGNFVNPYCVVIALRCLPSPPANSYSISISGAVIIDGVLDKRDI